MNDSSNNSFNTNTYSTKVRLEDIDLFVYDLHHDTDHIVRDFHKNKAVMKTYFRDIITKYPDNEECILLLVYLVLSMRTKLIGIDKKIEEYIRHLFLSQIRANQDGGGCDHPFTIHVLNNLPFAFDNIVYRYVIYKMIHIQQLLEKQSETYLDQLMYSSPILNNSSAIVPHKEFDYFNSYCSFYRQIMTYIKNDASLIEKEFREDNLSNIVRYYIYRRIIEFDIKDEKYKQKNDTLREKIYEYQTGSEIIYMLYESDTEEVSNVVGGLRTKVSADSTIISSLTNKVIEELQKIKKNTQFDQKEVEFFSKTFDRLSNRVNLLENKSSGGYFLEELDDKLDDDIHIINQILYSCLRTGDSIHDFGNIKQDQKLLFDKKTFDQNFSEYLKHITFIVDKNKPNEQKTFFEFINQLVADKTKILGKQIVINRPEDLKQNMINLYQLYKINHKINDIEDYTITEMNRFLYNLGILSPRLKPMINKIYRPRKEIIQKIRKNIDSIPALINTANYVNRENLFEKEITDLDEEDMSNILSVPKTNLLMIIYDKNILDETHAEERSEIVSKVKEFLGKESVTISTDMGLQQETFFKMFKDADCQKSIENCVFIKPSRVLAEEWDPADNKDFKYHGEYTIPKSSTLTIVQLNGTDLLDTVNNMPICDNKYSVPISLDPKTSHVLVGTDIKVKLRGGEPVLDIGINGKLYTPEIKRIANKMLEQDIKKNGENICKLFYLKNSGDWGQVTSANKNKMFLYSDDRLCNYYSFLTDTSTAFTNHSNDGQKRFITFLHKGNIEMSWEESFEYIKKYLIEKSYYLFAKEIEIIFKLKLRTIYSIKYGLLPSGVNIINYEPHFTEWLSVENLQEITLKDIKYDGNKSVIPVRSLTIDGSVIKEVKLHDQTVESKIKKDSVLNDITIVVSKKLEESNRSKIDNYKSIFLWKNKDNVNFNKSIYEKYFYDSNNYPKIISKDDHKYLYCAKKYEFQHIKEEKLALILDKYTKVPDMILNCDEDIEIEIDPILRTDIDEFVKNEVINYIDNKIVSIYLLSLSDKRYKNILNIRFNKIYTNIEYTESGFVWKKIENLILENNEYEEKLEKYKTEFEDDSKLEPLKITPYKLYSHKKGEFKFSYEIEKYNYKITDGKPEQIVLSNLLTNGVWDIFGMNPFIYSLFSKYLLDNTDKIPYYTGNSEIVKKLYQNISLSAIEQYLRLKIDQADREYLTKVLLHIENARKVYRYQQSDDSNIIKAITDKETKLREYINLLISNIDILENINKFNLFYYIYNLILEPIAPSTPSIDISIQHRETQFLSVKKSVFTYNNISAKQIINIKYLDTYLEKVEKILDIKNNTEIEKLLLDKNIIQYFESIIKDKTNINILDTYINSYLKNLESKSETEWEYLSEVMNIIKLVIANIDQNNICLQQSNNYSYITTLFQNIVSYYIDEYDRMIELLQNNKDKCCVLTRSLLETILEQTKDINKNDILKNIIYFIESALTCRADQPEDKIEIDIETIQKISEYIGIYERNSYDLDTELEEEQVDEHELEVEVSLEEPIEVSVIIEDQVEPLVATEAVAEAVPSVAANASSSEIAKRVSIQSILNDSARLSNPKCIAIQEYRAVEGCPIGDHELPSYECKDGKAVKGSNKLNMEEIKKLLRCIGVEIPRNINKKRLCDLLEENRDCFQEGILFDGEEVKSSSGGAKDVSKNGCILS